MLSDLPEVTQLQRAELGFHQCEDLHPEASPRPPGRCPTGRSRLAAPLPVLCDSLVSSTLTTCAVRQIEHEDVYKDTHSAQRDRAERALLEKKRIGRSL